MPTGWQHAALASWSRDYGQAVDRQRTVRRTTLVPTAATARTNTSTRVPIPRATGSTPVGATT